MDQLAVAATTKGNMTAIPFNHYTAWSAPSRGGAGRNEEYNLSSMAAAVMAVKKLSTCTGVIQQPHQRCRRWEVDSQSANGRATLNC